MTGGENIKAEREKTQFELPRGLAGRVTLKLMNLAHRSFYENMAKVLELRPEDNLLEVGCGNGYFLRKYASHVHHIAGLDISELCIKMATKKNKEVIAAGIAEFVQDEAAQLPWEENKFSVATSMAGVMTFPEPLESLKEIYRVLIPGGRVVIGIEWNAGDGKNNSKKYGMKVWTEDDVRNILREAGFSDIAITYAKRCIMPKVMIAHGVKK